MSNWELLNKARLPKTKDPVYGSTPEDGFNGAFYLLVNKVPCLAIASDGYGWKHVSVTVAHSTIPPSWSIMCQIKDFFWEPEDVVMQLHPAKSTYVNHHPGCLHLWQPTTPGVEIPIPQPILVGHKFEDGRSTKDEANVTDHQRREATELEKYQDDQAKLNRRIQ